MQYTEEMCYLPLNLGWFQKANCESRASVLEQTTLKIGGSVQDAGGQAIVVERLYARHLFPRPVRIMRDFGSLVLKRGLRDVLAARKACLLGGKVFKKRQWLSGKRIFRSQIITRASGQPSRYSLDFERGRLALCNSSNECYAGRSSIEAPYVPRGCRTMISWGAGSWVQSSQSSLCGPLYDSCLTPRTTSQFNACSRCQSPQRQPPRCSRH
jgi:hypothetical protein